MRHLVHPRTEATIPAEARRFQRLALTLQAAAGDTAGMEALRYDGQLQFTSDQPEPVAGPGEAVIEVRLAGICATDLEIVRGYMAFRGVLGHEFVGTVVQGSSGWQGRRVVGEINCPCGGCDLCRRGLANHCLRRTVLGISGRDGAFADRLVLPEGNLHLVPDMVSDEQAVFAEPLAAACQVTAQCRIGPHDDVAVVGSGRLGLLVAQVLKQIGCKLRVIGRNQMTLLFCEKRGISAFPVGELRPQPVHDVVVECSGSPQGLELAMSLVRPRGTLVLKSTYVGAEPVNLAPLVINEVNLVGSRCGPFPAALELLARRKVDVESMISRTLPLSRGVEAMELAGDPRVIKVLLKPGA